MNFSLISFRPFPNQSPGRAAVLSRMLTLTLMLILTLTFLFASSKIGAQENLSPSLPSSPAPTSVPDSTPALAPAPSSTPAPSSASVSTPTEGFMGLDVLQPQPSGHSILARLYREKAPSVVYVTGVNVHPEQKSVDEFFNPAEGSSEEHTVGTGFILQECGYIITNAHAVTRTLVPEIELRDGRRLKAEIAAILPNEDLALLKVETPEMLNAVKIEPNDGLEVGDTIVTIGCPHGLKYTLNYGIISATDRRSVVTDIPGLVLSGLLQTDAPINPGSSGGPWFNLAGNVVGMTVSKRGDSDNISFGISLETIRYSFPKMLHRAAMRKWSLPFEVTGTRKPVRHCASLTAIEPDFAQRWNLQDGDRILAVNGHEILCAVDFYQELLSKKDGETLTLTIIHADAVSSQAETDGNVNAAEQGAETWKKVVPFLPPDMKTSSVTTTNASGAQPVSALIQPSTCTLTLLAPTPVDPQKQIQNRLFLTIKPLSTEDAQKFNLRVPTGLVIQNVEAQKYQNLKHIPRSGDLLARINYERPTSPEHLAEILENLPSGVPINLVILRREEQNGKTAFTRIDINNWSAH